MNMKNIKVTELEGSALDWSVAKATDTLYPAGDVRLVDGGVITITSGCWHRYSPSTDWAVGGPIIEREGISVEYAIDPEKWCAWAMADQEIYGATALIAAMRCYVASKLGDEIDIPAVLL